jgi:hypothetical protein
MTYMLGSELLLLLLLLLQKQKQQKTNKDHMVC